MTDKDRSLLPVIPGNAQHIGARSEQQDSFGFSHFDDAQFVRHAGVLCVVADGMGGLALGRDSSNAAVQTFLATYAEKEPDEEIARVLDRALHAANRAVNRQAAQAGVEGEAGTTLAAVVIFQGRLYRVSAGDSRIYLFRDGALHQITTDYNYGRVLDRMVEKGDISGKEAASHPSRAALTSYLGKAEVDEYDRPSDPPLELLPGDRVLLASDGLFGFLPEDAIAQLMQGDPQHAAEALVQATLSRNSPYQDNITVAILGYGLPQTQPLAQTETPGKPQAATVRAKPQRKPSSGMGRWVKVAVFILMLAVAGFFGGRYLGEQGLAPSRSRQETPAGAEKTPVPTADKPADKPAEGAKIDPPAAAGAAAVPAPGNSGGAPAGETKPNGSR